MEKYFLVCGLVLFSILLIIGIFYFYDSESQVKGEIEKANYCEVKDDCVQVESKCPFDCYVFINKNEAERIEELISGYDSNCVYSCVALQGYECVENKCAIDIDAPSPYEIIAENLEIPWEIEFLPNGEMIITERPGRLLIIGEDKQVIEVEGVMHVGEGGLLGLALHPDFSENNLIYLYFTSDIDGEVHNRVERYRLENNILEDKTVILDDIPGARNHDGGRIAFGPDGHLYITTGDAGNEDNSQDIDSLAGKILRVDEDGNIPSDNPFGNKVYSYGHRNPQGLAWDEEGNLFSTEHGRSGISSGFDEINLIEIGNNYGWPEIEGDEAQDGMEKPLIHSGPDNTWAPASAAYHDGNIFFTGLRGQALYQYNIETEELIEHFANQFGRLRDVEIHEGYLYFSTSNRDGRGNVNEGDDKIIRVSLDFLE